MDIELVVQAEVPALRRAVAVVAELGQHIVRFPRQAVQALIRRSSRVHMGQVGAGERVAGAGHCNSDTFWISETDSATNRESITILHMTPDAAPWSGRAPAS